MGVWIINHPFGNGLYKLSMVIRAIVYYCYIIIHITKCLDHTRNFSKDCIKTVIDTKLACWTPLWSTSVLPTTNSPNFQAEKICRATSLHDTSQRRRSRPSLSVWSGALGDVSWIFPGDGLISPRNTGSVCRMCHVVVLMKEWMWASMNIAHIMLHLWKIYPANHPNVGKYSSTMEHMGKRSSTTMEKHDTTHHLYFCWSPLGTKYPGFLALRRAATLGLTWFIYTLQAATFCRCETSLTVNMSMILYTYLEFLYIQIFIWYSYNSRQRSCWKMAMQETHSLSCRFWLTSVATRNSGWQ